MAKFFGFLLLVVVVVVLLVGGVLWYQAPWLLSNLLSSRYGAPVKIESISFHSNGFTIKGFRIENWEGSAVKDAFAADEVRITMNPWDLFTDEIYIKEIDFNNATLGIELYNPKGTDNNWVRILERMEIGKSRDPKATRKRYFVDNVTVDRLDIHLYSHPLKAYVDVEPLQNLRLTEVDPDKPLAIGPVTAAVYRAVLAKVSEQALLPKVIKGVVEKPAQLLEGVLRLFRPAPEN
jgi:hypothetical protein